MNVGEEFEFKGIPLRAEREMSDPQQHLRTILGHRQDKRLSFIEILRCISLSIKVLFKKFVLKL